MFSSNVLLSLQNIPEEVCVVYLIIQVTVRTWYRTRYRTPYRTRYRIWNRTWFGTWYRTWLFLKRAGWTWACASQTPPTPPPGSASLTSHLPISPAQLGFTVLLFSEHLRGSRAMLCSQAAASASQTLQGRKSVLDQYCWNESQLALESLIPMSFWIWIFTNAGLSASTVKSNLW